MAANNRLIRIDPLSIELYPTELDLKQIPLCALRSKARAMMSQMLNPPKIFLTDEGLRRDWRGVLDFANLSSAEAIIAGHHDPLAMIMKMWTKDGSDQNITFDQLLSVLGRIDRWDVADDIKEALEEDAKFYITNRHNKAMQNITASTIPAPTAKTDENILTIDDVTRSFKGLPPQQYDAFVLFADEDIDFATELIERMEDYGFKLCVKERDLVGGVSFEHEAILRLISDRCVRLIVIVSPAFLESPANAFFVNYAQALGIETRQRKIVPCVYRTCVLPPTLCFSFLLYYQRSGRFCNFWEKLKNSIQGAPVQMQDRNQLALPSITISDVSPSSTIDETNSVKFELDENSMTPRKTPRRIKMHSSSSEATITSINSENNSPITNLSSSNSYTLESPRSQSIPLRLWLRSSSSMVNLTDTPPSSDRMHINSKLSSSTKSIPSTKKKRRKWFKKLLSPSTVSSNN